VPIRQRSGGFSPSANTDSKSSRLSMSGLALSSVRVVMAGGAYPRARIDASESI
jgi:hypothetical protein